LRCFYALRLPIRRVHLPDYLIRRLPINFASLNEVLLLPNALPDRFLIPFFEVFEAAKPLCFHNRQLPRVFYPQRCAYGLPVLLPWHTLPLPGLNLLSFHGFPVPSF